VKAGDELLANAPVFALSATHERTSPLAHGVLGEIFASWVAGRAAVSGSRVKGLTPRAGISERRKHGFFLLRTL